MYKLLLILQSKKGSVCDFLKSCMIQAEIMQSIAV